jgi:hypothetical protein
MMFRRQVKPGNPFVTGPLAALCFLSGVNLRSTLLAAVLTSSAVLLLQLPFLAQSKSAIEGVVLEADTDRPLEGVTVSATSAEHTHQVMTDSKGRFTIDPATAGHYRLTPVRQGMVYARPARLKAPREPGVWVDVSSGSVQDVQLRMVREAIITGRVLDSDGNPFPAVQGRVAVQRYAYDERGTKRLSAVPVVHDGSIGTYGRMDDRGVYRLYGLQPGDYYVSAGGGGVARFYPGTPDETSAQAVHVNAGEEVRLTTIILPAQKRFRVRFRFASVDGKSISESVAGSTISLHTKEGSVLVSMSGFFFFGGQMPAEPDVRTFDLPPGQYDQLIGLTGMITRTELFYGHAAFNVADADTEVGVPVSRGLRVTGSIRLEDAGGTHPSPTGVWCRLYTDGPHIETVGASTRTGCLGAAFSPALYELEMAGMPPDAYVESAQASGEDILAKGLQLNRDTELGIVIRSPGSVIEGFVKNSSGETLADAVVALVPDAPARSAGLRYRSVISDVHGRYQLRGIAPGSYRLFAWDELEGAAYRNAEFMKDFEGKGKPVKFEKADRVSADVTAF